MKHDFSNSLPVMEEFYSLQGEGFHTGRAAYFIRLAGCDVGCVWCDVKESWDKSAHPLVAVDEIVVRAKQSETDFVIITGGEPCLHDLNYITRELKKAGLIVALETSGSSIITGDFDWICVSPKKFKAPLPQAFERAHELKIVIFNKHDFDWADEHSRKVKPECKLFLQPEWDKREEVLPMMIDYVKSHVKWRVSLQTHRVLGVR